MNDAPNLESDLAATLKAQGVGDPATKLPSGDAVATAIARVPSASDLTSDRLVQQVGIALTDVHGSVTRRLDEIQEKLDAIRASLQAENTAARGRIERFVRLATDAAVATHAIDDALDKLQEAVG